MKTVKIILGLAVVSLVFIFWSDIKGAVSAVSPDSKQGSGKEKTAQESAPVTPGISIRNKWQMPSVLKEISGLSYIDADRFACVQDELGKIFVYNTKKSAIEKEIDFAGPGDYEGLAIVKDDVWVLRADGKLFEVSNYNSKPAVKEFDTHLTAEQNAEGLCYDKENNRLLVAIKDEEPGNTAHKGIYSFDLVARTMPEEPVFKIDMRHELFSNGKKGKKKGHVIKPSAITVHPSIGDIYLTDGPNSKLLVLSKTGSVKKLYQLNEEEFTQPEGITFTPSGELFISNEGVKKSGSIIEVSITD